MSSEGKSKDALPTAEERRLIIERAQGVLARAQSLTEWLDEEERHGLLPTQANVSLCGQVRVPAYLLKVPHIEARSCSAGAAVSRPTAA